MTVENKGKKKLNNDNLNILCSDGYTL